MMQQSQRKTIFTGQGGQLSGSQNDGFINLGMYNLEKAKKEHRKLTEDMKQDKRREIFNDQLATEHREDRGEHRGDRQDKQFQHRNQQIIDQFLNSQIYLNK